MEVGESKQEAQLLPRARDSSRYDQIDDSGRSADPITLTWIYDLRKFYFTNRLVITWNCVPTYVVWANMLNCFNSRLDK